MKTSIFVIALVCTALFTQSYGQEEEHFCPVTLSTGKAQGKLQKGAASVNATTMTTASTTGSQNLVILFVDYPEGRKQPGNILPTTDADTMYFRNIINNGNGSDTIFDAIGGMGWVYNQQTGLWNKKIRKYTYDDYWNMYFGNNYIYGHPDSASHGILTYGSFKDYYKEVSYGNLTIVPYQTKSGTSDKYHTGIVNAIDAANGKKYVRWIMMPNSKSSYTCNGDIKAPWDTADINPVIRAARSRGETNFNVDTYQGKIIIVGTGSCSGGIAEYIGGRYCSVREKRIHNYDNKSTLDGIWVSVHEFGHLLGFVHLASGSYDPMNVTIRDGWIKHLYCPPHFNPLYKLQAGWISTNYFAKLHSSGTLNLSPSNSNHTFAAITLYGDAMRNNDASHSEYFVLEYRTRNGFNRFAGGQDPTSFNGGVLIWHYSSYGTFTFSRDAQITNIGLKINNYCNEINVVDSMFLSNTGDPSHFYYSGHYLIDSTTTPNTSSLEHLTTGIALSNFSVANNQININADYKLGASTYINFCKSGDNIPSTISGNVYIENGAIAASSTTINNGDTVTIAPNATLFLKSITSIAGVQGGIVLKGAGYGSYHTKWSQLSISGNGSINIQKNFISDLTNGISIENDGDTSSHPILTNNIFTNGPPTIKLSIGTMDNHPYEVWFPDLSNTNYSTLTIIRGIWKVPNGQNITIPVSSSWLDSSFYYYPLSPPTEIKMGTNSNLIVNGKLTVAGSSENNVVFTSLNGTSPGSWGSIIMNGSGASGSNLNHMLMQYGTDIQFLNGANGTLQNSTLQYNTGSIYISNSSPILLNDTIIPPPTISLNPASLGVDYGSGSTSITISNIGGGTLNWSVTSSDTSWLTISPSSGTNNGTITVNYTANTSASPRLGTITINGTSATNSPQTVTVIQKASPPIVSMWFTPESGTQVDSAVVTISYSVNQPASVTIYVDWVPLCETFLCGSGQCTTTLYTGSHTIYIDAGNNNDGNSVSETYNVLYPSPPTISNLTVSPTGNYYYTISFSVESYNQQVSTYLYVDNNVYAHLQNMGGDFSDSFDFVPGTTHQVKVTSTNNSGGYNEAYASFDVPAPPPTAPIVYIGSICQDGISGYDVYFSVVSGNQPVSTSCYIDGLFSYGWQNTGGSMCAYVYLEPGTHEICFIAQNTYGVNEACTSIEVVPPAYPAPTISQFVTSLTTYGTVIVNFYVDSDDQPVDIKLYYGSSCDEWQNTGGYISDEISVASISDNMLTVDVSNAYGRNEQTVYPLESTPGSTAARKSIVPKESSVLGTTNFNGNFVEKNVNILSSKSASFNSSSKATSTLSDGGSIVVTSNKNLPRKNIINILSANVKKDVVSNKIGTYTVLRKSIEHTWDIKSNQDKKAFISLECPSLDIQSNKGNQKAINFKNDNQNKNLSNKNASFDMGLSKDDTISTRFKISYSHLNAFGIKMSKGIEFKITVDANESNGKNHDAYQTSIKEPLSDQKTDSLGIAKLDKAIKWVVPKDMQSVKIVPIITENIIDSSLKVNIAYEITSSQDSIKKDQASLEKGVQIYQETKVEIPTVFAASQNYPNPFNPSTVIRYQLPAASFVKLVVYDIMGREVAILAEGTKNIGYYTSTFDGSRFASGIYFARLTAIPQDGNRPFAKVMKMSLMK